MSIGFIYAGQGSQYVGMGLDFYREKNIYKQAIDEAKRVAKNYIDKDLDQISFEGSIEELSKTKYTQPAMVAYAIGVTKLLHDIGIKSDYCMGLSLGEYSALYEAGVIDENEAIELVCKRGKYMTEASENIDTKMCAVLGAERETVIRCCNDASKKFDMNKICEAVNFNCPGQIVISGHSSAVYVAGELLLSNGAKRVIPLQVSGPFHTSLMKKAGDKLAIDLKNIRLNEMRSKVIFNSIGREKNESESISVLLEKQVQSPVYLEDSIRYMADKGVDKVIEIGPGKALSRFVAKTIPEMKVYSINSVEDFYQLKEEQRNWA